jgi:hypothetical protein
MIRDHPIGRILRMLWDNYSASFKGGGDVMSLDYMTVTSKSHIGRITSTFLFWLVMRRFSDSGRIHKRERGGDRRPTRKTERKQ